LAVVIAIAGPDADDFAQTNDCPTSLAPADRCEIVLTFTPAAPGDRAAALSVIDNDPMPFPLTGSGVAPVVPSVPLGR
jgi:hypothetical protein